MFRTRNAREGKKAARREKNREESRLCSRGASGSAAKARNSASYAGYIISYFSRSVQTKLVRSFAQARF